MIRHCIRFAACALIILCFQAVAARAQQQPGGQASDARASENLIDGKIPEDAEVKDIIAPYRTKVVELSKPIGRLAGDIKKEGMGGGAVGNFVADGLRAVAEKKLGKPVLLSIVNTSGIRKNWIGAGELRSSDIFEMLPFENALVTLDLTGEQLLRFMEINVRRGNAQSGARIVYRENPEKKQNELVGIKLSSGGKERGIDPKASYTIVTIDYLIKRGGDYSILQEARNVRPLNVTMRDALLEYVKAETAAGRPIKAGLDGRFRIEGGSAAAGGEMR